MPIGWEQIPPTRTPRGPQPKSSRDCRVKQEASSKKQEMSSLWVILESEGGDKQGWTQAQQKNAGQGVKNDYNATCSEKF